MPGRTYIFSMFIMAALIASFGMYSDAWGFKLAVFIMEVHLRIVL